MDALKQLKRSLLFVMVFISFCDIEIVSSQSPAAQGDCNNTWITMTSMHSVGGTLYPPANGNAAACLASCLAQSNCTGADFDGAAQCWWTYTPPVYDPTNLVTHFALLRGLNSCNGTGCLSRTSAGWLALLNTHVVGGVNNSAAVTVTACLQLCLTNSTCNGFVWNAASTPSCFLLFNSNPTQTQQNLTYYQKLCTASGYDIVTPNFIAGPNGGSSAMYISSSSTAAQSPTVLLTTSPSTKTGPNGGSSATYISSSSTAAQSPTVLLTTSPSTKNPGNEASGLQVMTSLWIVTSVALFDWI